MNKIIQSVGMAIAVAVGGWHTGATASLPSKRAIIFDLGNVLVTSDAIKAFQLTGLQHFAWYFGSHPTMVHNASRKIRSQLLYPFLHAVRPVNVHAYPVWDEYGERIPQIMVDWLQGTIHPQTVQAICREKCALYSSWFSNTAERDLVCALTKILFTPQTLAHTQRLVEKSAEFARACKKRGYRVYILSNFDKYTFAELEKRYPDFFDIFDGKIISGQCGLAKPDPEIYHFLLNVYQLDPRNCFFIDDVMQNVEAAERMGISAAQCIGCDIDTIKFAFYAWAAHRHYSYS